MNKAKILIVDDEEDLCEILQFNIESEGFETDVAYSAEEALKKPLEDYSLILLDVMMGKMSGFSFADKLRKERKMNIPIIFLTAKDSENDTMTGFNLGADDYISKPFSIKEVIARVKAVINRTSKEFQSLQQIIEIEGLTMDISKKKLFIDSETINLTKKEFKILQLLLQYRGRIFERYEILDRVWADDVIVTNRTVDVNITRIRKKIGNYGKYIISRSGYGYCFEI
ncbi:MAG: DNA-binding response regulator [Bacteroidetes bacterium 4484_276]|nr:MAG: DNA-binding response regulator [Bacteroidetes bacterium 4484_276]